MQVEALPARPSNRMTIALLIGLTIAPVLLSTLVYFYWKPTGGKSFGELLPTRPVPQLVMHTLAGQAASLNEFKGKWLLLMADKAQCDAACQNRLFAMRQFRLAQGLEMERVKRLWLVVGDGMPSEAARIAADGAEIRRVAQLPPLPGDVGNGIYLIDPLGNQVVRYPQDATPAKVIKEIGRFLKNNQSLG
ncbi:hypothetical protein [Chitinimonas sp.]|uniref:hypothetical protein n=1 Tax=Chitinimonas sp. TaxID=1934313 RepID=UPI0035B2E02F